MMISVVTVCKNAAETIEKTVQSVASQTYGNVEHIVVDGASNDGTVDVLERSSEMIGQWVTEPDNGIYDAMNKGVSMAKGDVIGFLNADDVYAHPNVLARISEVFLSEDVQACFGDVVMVRSDLETVVRYYRSNRFSPSRLSKGWMPAHPGLYLKTNLFHRYGNFRTDYRIAADYELVVRYFGVHQIAYRYLPEVLVKMRVGGASTRNINSNLILNREIVRACRENGIQTNLFKVLLKFPQKMMELLSRPS